MKSCCTFIILDHYNYQLKSQWTKSFHEVHYSFLHYLCLFKIGNVHEKNPPALKHAISHLITLILNRQHKWLSLYLRNLTDSLRTYYINTSDNLKPNIDEKEHNQVK